MADTLINAGGQAGEAAPRQATGIRIDPPHVVARGEPNAALLSADSPTLGENPQLSLSLIQQLRAQAEQLSTHLRAQEKELEQREAQVNARAAEVDNQARTARLWMQARRDELQEKEADLERQKAELEGRWTRRTQSGAATAQAESQQNARRAAELTAAEATLKTAREQFAAERAKFDADTRDRLTQINDFSVALREVGQSPDAADSGQSFQRAIARFLSRQEYLDQAEALLGRSQGELEAARDRLTQQAAEHDERMKTERRNSAIQQRQSDAELEKKRQALDARAAQLETRRVALDELRSDLTRMHRESLEMRLATEEVWAQLAGTVPSAALTHSLGQIRSRLAEQYRLAQQELDLQSKELEAVAGRLAGQHEKLAEQRREWQAWLDERQAELQEQSSRLAAREQQFEELAARQQADANRGEQERSATQAEVGRLLAQLRKPASTSPSISR